VEGHEPTPIAVPDGLRGLAPEAVAALRDARVALERLSALDEATTELVRIGTLVGLGAPEESVAAHVARARAIGVADDDVWGAVLAVATLVGVPRLVSAVPAVRAALEG
jgi:alkylhydroperoxidase/carboxymuconolactone decarboxylase family protein YurZ